METELSLISPTRCPTKGPFITQSLQKSCHPPLLKIQQKLRALKILKMLIKIVSFGISNKSWMSSQKYLGLKKGNASLFRNFLG